MSWSAHLCWKGKSWSCLRALGLAHSSPEPIHLTNAGEKRIEGEGWASAGSVSWPGLWKAQPSTAAATRAGWRRNPLLGSAGMEKEGGREWSFCSELLIIISAFCNIQFLFQGMYLELISSTHSIVLKGVCLHGFKGRCSKCVEERSVDDQSVTDHSCLRKPHDLNTVGVWGGVESVVIV